MITDLKIDNIPVQIVRKNIKYIHITILPPSGRVKISAPLRVDINTIKTFATSKIEWIKKHQKMMRQRVLQIPKEYFDPENRYLWGKPYQLKVEEKNSVPAIFCQQNTLLLQIRPGANQAKREHLINAWYRQQLKDAATPLILKWEPLMEVKVEGLSVQKMKTRWGSCNILSKSIRLNTELISKVPECLEYVVVHEMVHLLERTHNSRFKNLMDHFLPTWRLCHAELNKLPLRLDRAACKEAALLNGR